MLPEKLNRFSCSKMSNPKHLKTCKLNSDSITILMIPGINGTNYYLTLIRLGLLRVFFSGVGQFDPPPFPFIFQEELITYLL